MKFVLGKPHKLVPASWYLVVDCRDAEKCVASILRNNWLSFTKDPHQDDISPHIINMTLNYATLFDLGTHERSGWYVNHRGGMCPKLVEILKEVKSDSWPGVERISISKWPAGKHFYAKVDEQDVVWNGVNKWCSERAAMESAKAFMNKKDSRQQSFREG